MALTKVALPCLVFLLSLTSFASLATSQQCQYVIRVKTGDRDSAGTDSIIGLKLMSSSGNGFTVNNLQSWGIMAPSHDYFEKGSLDIFNGRGPCVNVCTISVTSNGEGNKPGWYLDYVKVFVSGAVSMRAAFPVNQWLALDEWPKHLYANVNLCPRLKH